MTWIKRAFQGAEDGDKYKIIKTSRSSHPHVTRIKQSRHLHECFSTRSYGNLWQTLTTNECKCLLQNSKNFSFISSYLTSLRVNFSTYGKDESTRQSLLVGFSLYSRRERSKKIWKLAWKTLIIFQNCAIPTHLIVP